jgi:hypothetical protein
MRWLVTALWMSTYPLTFAVAQVSFGITVPGVSIGINMPVYPRMVPVPGYPVYYAPSASSNYFFFDGMYWVFQEDRWYSSAWYNGPWMQEAPDRVPAYVLRVPVRYYRHPPAYFAGWQSSAPPRWGDRWGSDWQRQHRGWDTWDRRAAPPPAPLPAYQRQFKGRQYPQQDRQRALHDQRYQYQPRDTDVRQSYQAHGLRDGPPRAGPGSQRATPPHQDQPKPGRHQDGREDERGSARNR